MTPLILEHGRARAAIAVEFGFNCYEFRAQVGGRGADVIDTLPEFLVDGRRPSHSGLPILFPFPNRIRGGRFLWNGQEFVIPPQPDRADVIHGYALDTAWRVLDHGPRHAVGQWQLSVDAPHRAAAWPADCLIEVRYDLEESALRSRIRIRNPDTRPLPWGFGTHTYFKLPLAPEGRFEDCLLRAPAHQLWVLDQFLPTGERIPVTVEKDLRQWRRIGTAPLDDVYGDVRPEGDALECLLRDPAAGLEIAQLCDPIFRELVVYTPPNRHAVCMEPYTCVTDAVNLHERGIDAGWRVLEPGGEFTTWIDILVRPVGA